MPALSLDKYEFVRVSGPDTDKFLQGQLSCDMAKLTPANALRGALCNLKGRVILDFRIVRDGSDCLLQMNTGLAELFISTLTKYAVFSKVELSIDENMPAPLALLPEGSVAELEASMGTVPEQYNDCTQTDFGLLINVGRQTPRFELWSIGVQKAFPADLPAGISPSAEAWQHATLQDGEWRVPQAHTEEFTPQLLNYDISGVIDFNKGCYTGQEVVARMYYRATPKQRLYLLRADQIIDDSMKICYDSEDNDKAEDILAASTYQNEHLALAILNITEMESGSAGICNSNIRLEVVALPYSDKRATT